MNATILDFAEAGLFPKMRAQVYIFEGRPGGTASLGIYSPTHASRLLGWAITTTATA